MRESLHDYYKNYEPIETKIKNDIVKREHYIFFSLLTILIMLSVSMYKK